MDNGEKIKFSFEYYDTNSTDYCISCWSKEQIRKSLKRLKEINEKSFKELLRSRRVYHFREVNWEKTTKPEGFDDTRVKKMAAFHFALLGINKQLARVYGAYSLGIFYIIWFDLDHKIWPTPLKNT